jgi:hypothetical protein
MVPASGLWLRPLGALGACRTLDESAAEEDGGRFIPVEKVSVLDANMEKSKE